MSIYGVYTYEFSSESHPKHLTVEEIKQRYVKGVELEELRKSDLRGIYQRLQSGYRINTEKFYKDYDHLSLKERQRQLIKLADKVFTQPEVLKKYFKVLTELLKNTERLSAREICEIFSRYARVMNEIKLQQLNIGETTEFKQAEEALANKANRFATKCVSGMEFGTFGGQGQLMSIYIRNPSRNRLDQRIFSEIMEATIQAIKRAISQIENHIESTEDSEVRSRLKKDIQSHREVLKKYQKALKKSSQS